MACLRFRRAKWVVDYRSADGKRRWQTCSSREEAERLLSEKIVEREEPIQTDLDLNMTVLEYSQRWYRVITTTLEAKTLRGYEQDLRLYIRPAFGSRPVRTLTKSRIVAYLADKLSGGLSRNTVRLIHATLRSMLSAAVDDGLIKNNPAAGVGKRLKLSSAQNYRQEEVKAFDRDQLDRLLNAAIKKYPRLYPLFLTMARSGLRPNEALALQWEDLDLNSREISVNKALTLYQAVKVPKSGRSRAVDMSGELRDALRRLDIERKAETLKRGWREIPPWVFCTRDGKPLDSCNVAKVFKRILKEAKLPNHYSPHCLRHTFASLLLSDGVSPAYVQAMMGHASIQLTVDTYGRWLPQGNKANVDRLDRTPNPSFSVEVVAEIGSSGRKNFGGYFPAEVGGSRSGSKTEKKWIDEKIAKSEDVDFTDEESGAGDRGRTDDLLITNQLLYH
jgi:integrase